MASLTTVVCVAVSCAVLFVVSSVIGTIVWVRLRKERLSLAVVNARNNGRYARGLQSFPADTVTELSREEGTALRQYGQLPYGRPTEWGLLTSREDLSPPVPPTDTPSHFTEKARHLAISLSFSRNKAKPQTNGRKFHRWASLASLVEPSRKRRARADPSQSKDDISISAVEGALELPAQTTPKETTPERDDDSAVLESTIRPVSPTAWPGSRRDPNGLDPVLEDKDEVETQSTRVRGGGITNRSAGTMPSQPVPPPPPVAYIQNRYPISRNDSLMRLSSISVDTADSDILDDNGRGSAIDASPALPPCPTFSPHKASSGDASKPTLPESFPTNSTLSDDFLLEPERTSPRRSLTSRSPSYASEHANPLPRRSESLAAKKPKRDSQFGSHLSSSGRESGLLPYFSQMQRHSMYPNYPNISDYSFGSPIRPRSPVRSPMQASPQTSPRRAQHSARGGSPRKGHKRQNCVRISIHPQMPFDGSGFPPTLEESEELTESDNQGKEVGSSDYVVSPISSRHTSQKGLSAAGDPLVSPRTPGKKRKKTSANTDGDVFSEKSKTLPGIFTSLPPTDEDELARTPPPDKGIPLATFHSNTRPASAYENISMGSPRRSLVRGPRSQPARQSTKAQRASMPLGESRESLPGTPAEPSPAQSPRPSGPRKLKKNRKQSEKSRSKTPSPGKKNGNSWAIWEDRKKSPKKSPAGEDSEKSTPRKTARDQISRKDFATPTKQRAGLGIGAGPGTATPVSLYDREGFLKE